MSVPAVGSRRWFRFRLWHLFLATALVALLAAWATRNWQRTQARLHFVANAGAVDGHVRTMQGYSFRRPSSVTGRLFGDIEVEEIWLYPGTYDAAYLARVRELFPEAPREAIRDFNEDD
ncbi:MAG: hypothetical protein AB7O59_11980 [Pirellulales bacterium]